MHRNGYRVGRPWLNDDPDEYDDEDDEDLEEDEEEEDEEDEDDGDEKWYVFTGTCCCT